MLPDSCHLHTKGGHELDTHLLFLLVLCISDEYKHQKQVHEKAQPTLNTCHRSALWTDRVSGHPYVCQHALFDPVCDPKHAPVSRLHDLCNQRLIALKDPTKSGFWQDFANPPRIFFCNNFSWRTLDPHNNNIHERQTPFLWQNRKLLSLVSHAVSTTSNQVNCNLRQILSLAGVHLSVAQNCSIHNHLDDGSGNNRQIHVHLRLRSIQVRLIHILMPTWAQNAQQPNVKRLVSLMNDAVYQTTSNKCNHPLDG